MFALDRYPAVAQITKNVVYQGSRTFVVSRAPFVLLLYVICLNQGTGTETFSFFAEDIQEIREHSQNQSH